MNLTFIPSLSVILVTNENPPRILSATKDNPNWKSIEQAIKDEDENALIGLISKKDSVTRFGNTGEIEVKGEKVYYRKQQLFGKDIERIISYIKEGFPHKSMIKFLEAKLKNPSQESVNSLYSFLENRGLPITDNGTVLGYKGVSLEYNSINTGSEPLISGKRNKDGSISNKIGEIIEMNREYVCSDNSNGCSNGLHIGSENYATDYGKKVMVVEFSPEHVVSVPTSEHQKLRVCKYRVVGELNEDKLGETYNNDYVRPDDEYIEFVLPNSDDNSDDAFNEGFKHGKGHQRRKFYEVDRGFDANGFDVKYIENYLDGYRQGRSTND